MRTVWVSERRPIKSNAAADVVVVDDAADVAMATSDYKWRRADVAERTTRAGAVAEHSCVSLSDCRNGSLKGEYRPDGGGKSDMVGGRQYCGDIESGRWPTGY